jgi:membrane-associated phospholipid phosphatase
MTTRLAVVWACGFYIAHFLKDLLMLPRPFRINDSIVLLERDARYEYGFPCGRTYSATCFPFYLFVLLNNRVGELSSPSLMPLGCLVLVAWWSLVSFSSVYLGAHLPLDVFAGVVLGLSAIEIAVLVSASPSLSSPEP